MNNPLQQNIEAVAKEKGIDPDLIITAIEEAVKNASSKHDNYKAKTLRTKFNPETGQVDLFSVRQIVEEVTDPATEISLEDARAEFGDEAEVDMEIEFPEENLPTRIGAQTAKQVIFQKVREAERDKVYEQYSDRVDEVISGTVKRFENGDIIVEAERVEALLPRREQSRAENYTTGDRIRAVIREVNKNTKGPQIILSRTDPVLLKKMFEQEIPEIYDGTVVIRGAVREAGDRSKVAVASRERDVDPVGACIGMKGTRVQAIIRELRGEKIDIVEWSDDPVVFVSNAISPARVQRVTVVADSEDPLVEVVVEDRQLSLAIGKKGQNVRLAARLTGWRIDIKSEEEKRREVEAQFAEIDDGSEDADTLTLPGLDEAQLVKLGDAGLDTADRLLEVDTAHLAEVVGVDEATAVELQAAVQAQVDAADQAGDPADTTSAAADPGADAAGGTNADAVDEPGAAAEPDASVAADPGADAAGGTDADTVDEPGAAAEPDAGAAADPGADAAGGTNADAVDEPGAAAEPDASVAAESGADAAAGSGAGAAAADGPGDGAASAAAETPDDGPPAEAAATDTAETDDGPDAAVDTADPNAPDGTSTPE